MSEKTYEVLEPVRIHRKSRDVGAQVVAHPDHVADLVASGVLRELDTADADRSTGDGSQLETGANSGTTLETAQSGASDGHEDDSQGGEGTDAPVKTAEGVSGVPPVAKPTKPAAKTSATKPGAKRDAAPKARK